MEEGGCIIWIFMSDLCISDVVILQIAPELHSSYQTRTDYLYEWNEMVYLKHPDTVKKLICFLYETSCQSLNGFCQFLYITNGSLHITFILKQLPQVWNNTDDLNAQGLSP